MSYFEIDEVIKVLQSGKSVGLDGIFPEFIKHIGPKVNKLLIDIWPSIVMTADLKIVKVIEVLKILSQLIVL